MQASTASRRVERPELHRWLVVLMAFACGVGVANTYFPQAITPLLASNLHVSRAAAAAVATTAQLGYAVGVFLLVPLGDRLSRRPLIAAMFGFVAVGLFLAGTTSSLTWLYVFSAEIGATTVVAQMLIPMAADMADGTNAGELVGAMQAGLLGGILLARGFGGTLGQWLGWRAPYLVAGTVALILALALAYALPSTKRSSEQHYGALIATSVRLFATLPDLRRSSLYQGTMFAGFTAAWTSIALFLTGPTYRYGTGVVGVVALVGAASIVLVPLAGRRTDRNGPDIVNLIAFVGAIGAAAVLVTGSLGGVLGLVGLMAGMLLLDISVQSSQVANQARILALVPEARSRLNSGYMTAVFLGGSAGSWIGVRIYIDLGWNAVCAFVACMAAVALVRHLVHRRTGPAVVVARVS
jgi:predicted MFS family arabinose efflux permease